MKRAFLLASILCVWAYASAFAGSARQPRPAEPCDIINIVSRFVISRLSIREPTTLRETLDFIYRKYRDIDDIDEGRETIFVFEYRLPEAILQRHVSFEATNISMTDALKLALKDIPVELTFASGRLIFSQPSPPKESPR